MRTLVPRFRSISALLGMATALLAVSACNKPEPKTKGEGDLLKSFIVKNVDSGQQYCQVCAFAGKPLIMAVAELGDVHLEETLVELQKVVDQHEAKGLKAFAVVGSIVNGKLEPPSDEARAIAELRALRAKVGLRIPVTVLPKKLSAAESEQYAKFHDAYELAGTPTVYLANVEDQVLYAGVLAPEKKAAELARLGEAIRTKL